VNAREIGAELAEDPTCFWYLWYPLKDSTSPNLNPPRTDTYSDANSSALLAATAAGADEADEDEEATTSADSTTSTTGAAAAATAAACCAMAASKIADSSMT
jgi:hypothetical protein